MNRIIASIGLIPFLTSAAGAVNVYVLSSTDPIVDSAVSDALTARGHTVTIGVPYDAFDGTVNLSGFQTVYLQCNVNWSTGTLMPVAGQQQLINWVNAGGRLVTSEWVVYYTYAGSGKFATLEAIIPAVQSYNYGGILSATYTAVTPDPVINASVPSPLTFTLTSFTGTETYTAAKPGATTYYTTSNSPGAVGLVGWGVGTGWVFSFTSTCGRDQLADTNFGRLFANVMQATAPVPPAACYANCDGSTGSPVLTGNDFNCFLDQFAAGASYANCDGSTGTPTLTGNDFGCFLNRFAAGCS